MVYHASFQLQPRCLVCPLFCCSLFPRYANQQNLAMDHCKPRVGTPTKLWARHDGYYLDLSRPWALLDISSITDDNINRRCKFDAIAKGLVCLHDSFDCSHQGPTWGGTHSTAILVQYCPPIYPDHAKPQPAREPFRDCSRGLPWFQYPLACDSYDCSHGGSCQGPPRTAASWVVAQIIGRAVASLPITTLDITTVAHVACPLITHLTWWYKPRGPQIVIKIDCSGFTKAEFDIEVSQIRIFDGTARAAWATEECGPNAMPIVDEPSAEPILSVSLIRIVCIFVVTAFGAIHCAAWNLQFPTAIKAYYGRLRIP